MKKIQLLLLVLVLVAFGSCKKESVNQNTTTAPKYVKTIAGSFVAKDGDIQFKDAPVGFERTWTELAKNSPFYTPEVFGLIDGREFITGSSSYNFWSVPANNPVTFPASSVVYSNNTPDELQRMITETKDAAHHVAYLGMLDFQPSTANFPLTIHCYRLGDVLQINTDALVNLPGGHNLTFSVKYNLAPVDLTATEAKLTLSGTNTGIPNGNEFTWADIQYGAPVEHTIAVPALQMGDFTLYDDLGGKVTNVVITITETGTGATPGSVITLPVVNGLGAGLGMKMVLTTTKIGWYDSQTINWSDTDIAVTTVNVPVN